MHLVNLIHLTRTATGEMLSNIERINTADETSLPSTFCLHALEQMPWKSPTGVPRCTIRNCSLHSGLDASGCPIRTMRDITQMHDWMAYCYLILPFFYTGVEELNKLRCALGFEALTRVRRPIQQVLDAHMELSDQCNSTVLAKHACIEMLRNIAGEPMNETPMCELLQRLPWISPDGLPRSTAQAAALDISRCPLETDGDLTAIYVWLHDAVQIVPTFRVGLCRFYMFHQHIVAKPVSDSKVSSGAIAESQQSRVGTA
jgi:hypothetical protein